MITIASTPEKTLDTLTGNECIPLSDKTHIKTSVFFSLSDKIEKALEDKAAQDEIKEHAMYRTKYSFVNNESLLQDNTLSIEEYDISNGYIRVNGKIIINVPHTGKYYVTLQHVVSTANTIITIGTSNYAASGKIMVTVIASEETNNQIVINCNNFILLDAISIVETPMTIEELQNISNLEIDKRQSSVDENGCLTLLI